MIGSTEATAVDHPPGANQQFAEPVDLRVQGNWLFSAILEVNFEVILQIFSDAW